MERRRRKRSIMYIMNYANCADEFAKIRETMDRPQFLHMQAIVIYICGVHLFFCVP